MRPKEEFAPNWQGSFIVNKVLPGRAPVLAEIDSDKGAPRTNGDQDQVIRVPSGLITRARAKKMRKSLQALVCTIQERIGDDLKVNEGLENENSTIYTLLQVDEPSEAES